MAAAPTLPNAAPPLNPIASPSLNLATDTPPTKFAYFGYIIMAAAFIQPFIGVYVFMSRNHIAKPEDFVALTLICLFIFVTMSTIGLIVLGSSGELQISEEFLKWLAGATIAEIAGMCTIILKAYFK